MTDLTGKRNLGGHDDEPYDLPANEADGLLVKENQVNSPDQHDVDENSQHLLRCVHQLPGLTEEHKQP
jgi:hypothetical protein